MKFVHPRSILLPLSIFFVSLASQSHGAALAISDASYTGSFTPGTPENITGNALISGITTTEGTFTNLFGPIANNITGGNSPSSVGTPVPNDPAGRALAVTGLTANDGANNIGAGNFQFSLGAFNADTRFFIIDTTPVANTVGDDVTITLIDSSNVQVGSFSFNLLASQFTSSPGGTTNTSLATVTYTQNQNANVSQKLGGATFSLADLGVSDYSAISSATGIRLSSGGLDPNVVGAFAIPEPSAVSFSMAALALGLCVRFARARRKLA